MDNLDDGCEPNCSRALVAKEFRGKQEQGWTNSLASARAQVFADLGDRRDIRDRVPPELLLDRDNIVAQQIENFFPVNVSCRTQIRPAFLEPGLSATLFCRAVKLVSPVIREL